MARGWRSYDCSGMKVLALHVCIETGLYTHVYKHDCIVLVLVLVSQSCPTFCDPRDCSPPGSSVHGIL